jgi:hypothetical protein
VAGKIAPRCCSRGKSCVEIEKIAERGQMCTIPKCYLQEWQTHPGHASLHDSFLFAGSRHSQHLSCFIAQRMPWSRYVSLNFERQITKYGDRSVRQDASMLLLCLTIHKTHIFCTVEWKNARRSHADVHEAHQPEREGVV